MHHVGIQMTINNQENCIKIQKKNCTVFFFSFEIKNVLGIPEIKSQ